MDDVKILISEPWDFKLPDGGKTLYGQIKGKVRGADIENWRGDYLLITLSESFNWNDVLVQELVVTNHLKGDTIEDILEGGEKIIRIGYVNPGVNIKVDSMFNPEDVTHFAMGSIQALNE